MHPPVCCRSWRPVSKVFGVWILLSAAACAAFGGEYHIGPGQAYETPFEMPWYELRAGDTVVIHWRAEPYRVKFSIGVPATAERPLIVRGEPGPNGELPRLDGRNAITPPTMNSWSEDRGVITLGETRVPDQGPPSHVLIENLEISGAHPDHHFLGSDGLQRYGDAASAVYVESGSHLTIRNCVLHDCANGFFSAHKSREVLVEACHIHSNGVAESYYQHNAYSASDGMTYQFNRFGPLSERCPGNNLKDRSAGLVVRYNRIDGGNRQLDLVEAEDSSDLVRSPRYSRTFVYGNLLIERPDSGNNQILHYGGDSGEEEIYRRGMLYFFNNTVVSYRSGRTTLMRLSTNGESAQIVNNILYTPADGGMFAVLDAAGVATVANNWFKNGWVDSHEGEEFWGHIIRKENVEGSSSPFLNFRAGDYRPAAGSRCVDESVTVTVGRERAIPVDWEYADPRGARKRDLRGALDVGAFEARP